MLEEYGFDQKVAAFWAKVRKTETCWIWEGAQYKDEYGQFHWQGKLRRAAHQVSFFLTNGYWPQNEIDHTCHNTLCVRPDHLRDVTHVVNINNRKCSLICKYGHPLADPNLYYYNRTGVGRVRRCLACLMRERQKIKAKA